jgi:hypothetical protein
MTKNTNFKCIGKYISGSNNNVLWESNMYGTHYNELNIEHTLDTIKYHDKEIKILEIIKQYNCRLIILWNKTNYILV